MARTLIRPISSTKTTATASTMGGGGKTAKRLPASRNSSVKKASTKQTGIGFTKTFTDRTTGKKTTTTGTLKPITQKEFNSNTPTKNRALAGRRRGR